MNEHKFAFIICTNDNLLLEEALHYINHLIVPDGFETEILTITDAPSMTAGYQEAMLSTDAKYKIYMHQDVFIINRNILNDLLNIFTSDQQIGMIGMIGYDSVSPDGIMWHHPRLGNIYQRKPDTPYPILPQYHYSLQKDGYADAALADGFFLATSYDLSWDIDGLKGFDFYDTFQSIRFLTHGYRICIPVQRHPWCVHDDNTFLDLSSYNHNRMLFIRAYPYFLGKSWNKIIMQTKKEN